MSERSGVTERPLLRLTLQEANVFSMVGMRKHIYRLDAIEIILFFDQVFHISLLCFGIAGDINNMLHTVGNDLRQCFGVDAVSGGI